MDALYCLDLKRQYQSIKQEVLAITEKVFEETSFSGGPYVESFEKNFATFCEADYSMAVNNGTTALHLAMLALNIGPDDEVIVPANTFIATAWGVSYVGAKIVFVDCDPNTWEIDVTQIESKITSKTKAIAGVHLYGQPFDVSSVITICKKHNLFLIEDAAQAQGAKFDGKRVGSFGEVACFSFYPGKNLGAYGEAGGLTTNSEAIYTQVQILKNHGSSVRYYHDQIGYNYRMDGLQGGILDIKLQKLDGWNQKRRDIARRYQIEISNSKIKMQFQPDNCESVYHLFVVTTQNREGLMKHLANDKIFAGLHYPVPCHLQKAYISLGYKVGDFPNAEYLASHCLSLPIFAEMTDQEISRVIQSVNNY
jgi:dTDP-4-amino-4,6-dideoxygalactose transaminase